MIRRFAPLLVASGLLVVLVLAASVLPIPYVTLSPGPTYNTLGQVDGRDLISISGTTTHPTSGSLDLVTVSEKGGPFGNVTVGDALLGWRDPTVRVVPREVLYPEPVDQETVTEENSVAFDESESSAIAASMRHLGTPVTSEVLVGGVSDGSPAAGKLAVGDVVVSVAGRAVTTPEELRDIVRGSPVGTALAFVVRQGDTQTPTATPTPTPTPTQTPTTTVTITSAARPEGGQPYVGIVPTQRFRAPFPIEFGLTSVGGPSAGLMFSLGIVDKLTTGELTGGRHIAGTGTISPEGEVGAIGGIAQKMAGARGAGAELFLAPVTNCRDIGGHVPEGLTVVPVATLDEAVDATEAWVAGRPVPTCPAG